MLSRDQQVFVRFPSEGDIRVLHPARVVDIDDDRYTIVFEEPDLSCEAGADISVFFERQREFMQQAARVHAIYEPPATPEADNVDCNDADPADEHVEHVETAASLTIGLELLGDPVSAENRQSYRVSTVIAHINVALGAESGCPLLDVSPTGFAVSAESAYRVSNTVDVAIEFDEQEFTGSACVQSVRDLGNGRFRYGLHCLADRYGNSSLERGLSHISSSLQRRQLRRLRGTG